MPLYEFSTRTDSYFCHSFSDGDKDMFRFAFLALRKRWAVPGRYVSVGALPSNTMTGFCGTTMLQHDHLGKPLFVHANLLKQIPSGIGKGKLSLYISPRKLAYGTIADSSFPSNPQVSLGDDPDKSERNLRRSRFLRNMNARLLSKPKIL